MEKKDLIIGGCTNYGINELKPWVLSANETMPNAHKVMCVGNATKETRDWLVENNFEIFDMPAAPIPIHVLRFLSIYEYLKDNYTKFNSVLTTDVKDVYFQQNPFTFLENTNIGHSTFKLIAGSECLKYKDEPWGNDNLMQAYGPYVHGLFKDKTIYNVGVLAGSSEYVKDLVFNIFINAINRPIPICDQAVFNVLLNTQPYKDVVHTASMEEGFACQAGTVADPRRMDEFRPNLLEKEPVFENGIVKTFDGRPFYIVHQYDRVPEWKSNVMKKYNQQDPQEYFIYKA